MATAFATIESSEDLDAYLLGLNNIGINPSLAVVDANSLPAVVGLHGPYGEHLGAALWQPADYVDSDKSCPECTQPFGPFEISRLKFPISALVDATCHGNETCLAPEHMTGCEAPMHQLRRKLRQ